MDRVVVNHVDVDVDGVLDKDGRIKYIGRAKKQPDGTWRCLADVDGMLCLVEVQVTPKIVPVEDFRG